jgi:carbamoyl-phosphate synthase large subunit
LNWSGPLEVEMLRCKQGEYHLIEINPRFPAWIYLSAAVGCNLPWALVKLLQKEEVTLAEPEVGKLFIRYAQENIITLNEYENMTMWGSR